MNVFFNDPFDVSSIERLKFLYLYCDQVEAMDYSPLFAEFTRDGWSGFLSGRDWEQQLDREIRKATGGRKIDRNELARQKMRARPQIITMQRELRARCDRIFSNHERYWRYLRELASNGIINLCTTDKYFDQRFPVRLQEQEAQLFARTTTDDLKAWLFDYLRSNNPDAFTGGTEEMQVTMALNAVVLCAYMMGALMKQASGASLYTGAGAQLRAVRALFESHMPAGTRLGEEVISIEVPILRSRDIADLVRAKEKLVDHRHDFIVEMNALAAGLEQYDWNDELLTEIKRQKQLKIDPILYDLSREFASLNEQASASGSPYAAGLGTMGITMAILAQKGVSLDLAVIGGIVAALGIGSVDWFRERYKERSRIDKNRLAYVINLRQELTR